MTNQQLAYMVRDNAIHQWRTVTEIAKDEGRALSEIEEICSRHLTTYDMDDIRTFDRRAA